MDTIRINNLNGGYPDNNILKDVSIYFEKNKLNAIIGPNGSGKSTLLKYLIKELEDKNKSISILDKPVSDYSQLDLARVQSLVPQLTLQEYEFTVKELVSFGRYCHKDINNSIVDKTIESVGLTEVSDKLITQISGGELQLAMLAKAICQETEIILLDEPTNNLDPKHCLILMDILTKLKKQNKTIICVLHDINAVLSYFDNAVLLKDGRIFSSGPVSDVITEQNIKNVYGINAVISPSRDRLPSTIYYSL